jgi:hypothetical protein
LESQDDDEDFGDDSDDEDDDVDINAKQRRKLVGSFYRMKIWYDNQYPRAKPAHLPVSPRKSDRKKGSEAASERPPLIVILEDFEAFSPIMLQKFVQNIRYTIFHYFLLQSAEFIIVK